jgi:predicted dehydrogenase
MTKSHVNIAIVGTGYVADLYMRTLAWHPQLHLVGVFDRDPARSAIFTKLHKVSVFKSFDAILNSDEIDLVLNLTNPREHFAVSKACLQAGKHVYSEKPLAMEMSEAYELSTLAAERQLELSSAPCSILGESAQTLWKALRNQAIGKVRLVYAEMDDGLVHKMPYKQWLSDSGFIWPYKDEFEVGCTLEHAGYYTTWLTAMFGPAKSVTAFSSCLVPDKETDVPLDPPLTPDFSVACIQFGSGVVARLTCSIVAPHDHSLRVIGDSGVLAVKDCWFYGNPVTTRRTFKIRRKVFFSPFKKNIPMVRKPRKFRHSGAAQMDFARGPAEVAQAILEGRKNRLGSDFSLHNNELVLAIQHAKETGSPHIMQTSFAPMDAMEWAK